jgi:DNA-directed RNA polymerase specialized sigma24 family protein
MPEAGEPSPTVADVLWSVSAERGRGTDRLVEMVYRERDAWRLQPTALVNGVSLNLVGREEGWESRAHLVGAGALALDEALERLERAHERCVRVAEQRYFGEMTIPEVAHVLGVSTGAVDADRAFAKAWLTRALAEETGRG